MTLSEKELSFLEEHIPELAGVSFKQAYWSALAFGSSVLISKMGISWRYFLMEPTNSLNISPPFFQNTILCLFNLI